MCFVVNNYVFSFKKVTIIAMGLKLGKSVHTSFLSVCRKLGRILLVDREVVAAYVPGVELHL